MKCCHETVVTPVFCRRERLDIYRYGIIPLQKNKPEHALFACDFRDWPEKVCRSVVLLIPGLSVSAQWWLDKIGSALYNTIPISEFEDSFRAQLTVRKFKGCGERVSLSMLNSHFSRKTSCTEMATAFAQAFAPRISAQRLSRLSFCPVRKGAIATTSSAAAEQAPVRVPHIPVLLHELSSFFPDEIDTFLDCTVGAGGHASHILRHKRIGQYVALDKDPKALAISRSALRPFDNVRCACADFRDMRMVLDELNVAEVNAVLMDIGTSSMQLDEGERGFSFTHDGPIDMRMSCTGPSAGDILATASESELADLFWTLGEERQSRKIARVLVNEREREPIESTKQLATLVERVKGWRKKGVHPATQVFQALRIATNDELAALEEGLVTAIDMAAPQATIAVISFHSLEDRIAKRIFKTAAARVGGVRMLTKKPVMAGEEECRTNPRARSAKLRVVRKLNPGQVPISGKVNKYRER